MSIIITSPFAVAAAPATKFDDTWWTPSGFIEWRPGNQDWRYTFFNGGTAQLQAITSGPNANWATGFTASSMDITIFSGTFGNPYNFTINVNGTIGTIGSAFPLFAAQNTSYVVNVPLTFGGNGDISNIDMEYGGAGEENWLVTAITFNP